MPAPSCRIYPARTSSLWLATSASAGASRKVGIKSSDQRCIVGFPIVKESSIVNDGVAPIAGERKGQLRLHKFRAQGARPTQQPVGHWIHAKTKPSHRETSSKYSCAGNLRILQRAVCDSKTIQRAQMRA